MAKSKSEILDDFQSFMGRFGGNYKDWFVGTAPDAKRQMFGPHGFKTGDVGLYRQAISELQAAEVAEFFTGMGARGDDTVKRGADFVYAYKLNEHTRPGVAKK